MNVELFIASRYMWSKRRHPFVGVVSTISVLGIAVGVAALIVVLAVMNGFDEDLKDRIVGMRAHVVIEKEGLFTEAPKILAALKSFPGVLGTAPYVEGQALIQNGEWGTGVLVRGIDVKREKQVSRFFTYLTKGTLSERAGGVAIGAELAKRSGLHVGSPVQIATQNTQKPLPATVEGIFSSGMYEYDSNLIFMNLKSAQDLYGMTDAVSGISIYLKNAEAAEGAKQAIHEKLGWPFYVRTWMDMNRTLFSALQLEKVVMFLILALIILVACLNIAGSLTIMVMDKTKDIGILKALGAAPLAPVKIFAWNGLILGAIGSGAGFVIGMALCWLLKTYSFVELPREIYYIERLPVLVNPADTAMVLAVALALSFVSALYPAAMAGRLDPVKALRYE